MIAEQLNTIQLISVWILPVLFAITVHEVAHGYVANFLGDKTAKMLGRLTLNPVKHIDIFGTIIVPLVLLIAGGIILGWAKPVPINSRNLAKPRRDMALIAVAGPLVNLLMAFIWAAIAKVSLILLQHNFPGALALVYMGQAGLNINLVLMVLNLLPIPPLDGGHVLMGILPKNLAMQFGKIAPYGFIILLLLLVVGVLNIIINPVLFLLLALIKNLFGI